MDRNMRSSYVSSGSRSLPHMGNKRHNNPYNPHNPHNPHNHNNNPHNSPHNHSHNNNGHNGNNRLSPPGQTSPPGSNNAQHDDLIHYIYESWNKVRGEVERGSDEARYFQESPRQLANFRPFNLDDWWARRLVQSINKKHRS